MYSCWYIYPVSFHTRICRNAHSLVYALPAKLLVCTVQWCYFVSSIRATKPQFAVALADHKTKGNTVFSEIVFNKSMIHLSSRKYWHYVGQISNLEPTKHFCYMMYHSLLFSTQCWDRARVGKYVLPWIGEATVVIIGKTMIELLNLITELLNYVIFMC